MENFVITLLICSVSMSALALLYMACTPLLAKRYSEKGRYYVWMIIIIGLIIPIRPQWDNPLINVEVPYNAPQTSQMADEQVLPYTQSDAQAYPRTNLPAAPSQPLPPVDSDIAPAPIFGISIWQIAIAVWLAGIAIFIAYHGIKHYRFVKMTRRWSNGVTDGRILSLFENLKSGMGITKHIPIYLCQSVGSPMILGYFRPQIFLPTIETSNDELSFILKHELVHYKRKDLLYKYIILAATAIHWFNPVVYLTAKSIYTLSETSCDAEVLQTANTGTRELYGKAIIGIVKQQSALQTAFSTNFYGGKNSMKIRILSIMDTGKKRAGAIIAAVVLVLALSTGFVLASSASASANPNYEEMPSEEELAKFAAITALEFELYHEWGLYYNTETMGLYFQGERVRFFCDMRPTPGNEETGRSGVTHTDVNGIVDVVAVRDESFEEILDVRFLTEEEFNARFKTLTHDPALPIPSLMLEAEFNNPTN